MYCQLGSIVFDGLKSFVSYSDDSEAVIVEHLLIGGKPRLEGVALSLHTLNISMYLHQEFTSVKDAITSLKNSKDTYEILTLLWGNGEIEGQFVIQQMTVTNEIMDPAGNLYAVTINLILKENANPNQLDQQQQQAQNNAFATGDKKPAAKSKRTNTPSCPKKISSLVSNIRSNAAQINALMDSYIGDPTASKLTYALCKKILPDCLTLVQATNDSSSCASGNISIRDSAVGAQQYAAALGDDVNTTTPNLAKCQTDNTSLQTYVANLISASTALTQKAIVRSS